MDGWTIEAYATQAAIPLAPSGAAGSPASRLHSADRCTHVTAHAHVMSACPSSTTLRGRFVIAAYSDVKCFIFPCLMGSASTQPGDMPVCMCCRKMPGPDPLASLEEVAARVLGRTLSAATPRAESAAAGLLGLAPLGRGGDPPIGAPDSPSFGSASQRFERSDDEASPDGASDDEYEVCSPHVLGHWRPQILCHLQKQTAELIYKMPRP